MLIRSLIKKKEIGLLQKVWHKFFIRDKLIKAMKTVEIHEGNGSLEFNTETLQDLSFW